MSLIEQLKRAIEYMQKARDSWERQGYFHHYNHAVGQIEAYENCIQAITDACTPRPPEPEWFGTGPGQWDSWWIQTTKESNLHRTALMLHKAFIDDAGGVATPEGWHFPISMIESCVPVARGGYPAPVGWQVLEVVK